MRNLLYLLILLPIISIAQGSLATEKKGQFSGQWRTFFSNTVNKGSLKDYSALATGGYIKYQYGLSKRLHLGTAIYNTTNLGLQDLTIADAQTGKLSRYEEGLFDILNVENDMIFLLGELYVDYSLDRHQFKLGRMKINTPFINPEDGRMIPTLVQGFWYKFRSKKENTLQLGILNQIAPRSTGEYFGIGESIGTYAVGRNYTGQTSLYAGNTKSDYVLVSNYNLKVSDNFQLDAWDYYVENIFNSLYVKPSLRLTPQLTINGEWLHQNQVGNGGNTQEAFQYFRDTTADVLGLEIDYTWKTSQITLGYDHIVTGGQFLFPREWGREDLFSFQKRERSEGSANNHALVFHYNTLVPLIKDKADMRTIFSLGKHWKPSVQDPILNKYAMPDYTHINLDVFFNFKRLKQLKPEILVTTKIADGNIPENPNFYFNKTDMVNINIILNYNF
ncbi:OprD family outer membrane porin [Maribacter sp. CXY002]|uniref:OprD family outer membrane porin n=1 Tax=Maribacter luteocoastalis TaxID=3407671 RepID=UPI003B671FE4